MIVANETVQRQTDTIGIVCHFSFRPGKEVVNCSAKNNNNNNDNNNTKFLLEIRLVWGWAVKGGYKRFNCIILLLFPCDNN